MGVPGRVPPLKVPANMWEKLRVPLPRLAHGWLRHLRSRATRDFLIGKFSMIKGAALRWSSRVNSPAKCKAFTREMLMHKSVATLAALARVPGLRAVDGAWRLPRWPTPDLVRKACRRSWRTWAPQVLPPRLVSAGSRAVTSEIDKLLCSNPLPDAPLLWSQFESSLDSCFDDCDMSSAPVTQLLQK